MPRLNPEARAAAQRILDRAARRVLDEQLAGTKKAPRRPGKPGQRGADS